jgi:hypothetical protein
MLQRTHRYSVSPTSTSTATPRRRRPKAVAACDGADVLDGLKPVTPKLVAKAKNVSLGYLAVARRLSSEQRDLVREGKRPLVQPRPVAPPVPTEPVTMGIEKLLDAIVAKIGIDQVLNHLAARERVAA